jgi:hypothetical protein
MAIVINGTGTVTGISVGGLPDAIVDLDTLAADSVNAAKIVDGTVVVGDIADDAISAAKLANSINTDIATGVTAGTTATAALPKAGGTMTGEVILDEITETEATSAASTYTVALANGTIFDLTSASTCTVTMPAFEAGKSFTVISTVPSAWAVSPAIIWSGGAAPTTGSGRTIYSFVSDGARWYGMQAGTGFA